MQRTKYPSRERQPNKLGQILRALRLRAGLTLEAVAKKIQSHKGYVSGIENGKVNPPSVKVLRRYHGALKVGFDGLGASVEDLVEMAEVVKAPELVRARLLGRIGNNPLCRTQVTITRSERVLQHAMTDVKITQDPVLAQEGTVGDQAPAEVAAR